MVKESNMQREMFLKYQQRLRYKLCKKSRRTGKNLERWLEVKLSKDGDPNSIVLRKRKEREVGEEEKDEDAMRVSLISNLRCKWGDEGGKRCLKVEFSDR